MIFIDFRQKGERESEREQERIISVREQRHSVASRPRPDGEANPGPRYVPGCGIEPTTFWCMGGCFEELSHLARAV